MVAGANVHDTRLLAMTLERVVVERPEAEIQHLCLDKGTPTRRVIKPCWTTGTGDTSGG